MKKLMNALLIGSIIPLHVEKKDSIEPLQIVLTQFIILTKGLFGYRKQQFPEFQLLDLILIHSFG